MDQSILKELVHYNPDTVSFTLLKTKGKRKAGQILGTLTHQGYLAAGFNGKTYLLHRLAFLYQIGRLPKNLSDHINGVRNDNRWLNLREATYSENRMNRAPNLNRGSLPKNVYWQPKLGRYRVKIKINKKTVHFGYYDDIELAELVATEVCNKYHGNYAKK